MSLVLCIGYALIKLQDAPRVLDIALTSLFVCSSPNYNATRHRALRSGLSVRCGEALRSACRFYGLSLRLKDQLVLLVITGVLSSHSVMCSMPMRRVYACWYYSAFSLWARRLLR